MTTGRIYFPGNPWPEGHPIKEFAWEARNKDGQVWFDLHLVTENYYSERGIEEPEDGDADYPSSWEAPGVWGNYHSCILSSTYWGTGGFPVAESEHFNWEELDGYELFVDEPPPEEVENNAFGIYLLGHDAVAQHRIKFTKSLNPECFDISWSGMVALAYVGDYEYKHEFVARIINVKIPSVTPST